MTNFEQIREISIKRLQSVTLEEFAANFAAEKNCDRCPLKGTCGVIQKAGYLEDVLATFQSCYRVLKKYLESEVEEE